MLKKTSSLLIYICFILSLSAQKKNIALTPPMGWNSWNFFGCDVSEKLIKDMADAMVRSGMADAGYEYVVIDDCWQVARDENNVLVADSIRFPNGIKALADYVHSKGLKFGIYSDAGRKTCQGRPGSWGYEELDAKTFEEWGVDYLKYDWCAHGLLVAEETYPIMGKALYELERPIVYSVCNWGWGKPWEWAPDFAHLWRTTIDIEDCFDCKGHFIHKNVEQILDMQDGLEDYATIGAWNDPDMLEVGNGLSHNENIAHFSLWCMLAAPLMSGNDLANMDTTVLSILTNKEAIAVNQDNLGVQGFRIYNTRTFEVWFKPLKNGAKALCIFNRNKETAKVDVQLQEWLTLSETYTVRDIWQHKDIGTSEETYQFEIPENAVVMLKLERTE